MRIYRRTTNLPVMTMMYKIFSTALISCEVMDPLGIPFDIKYVF